MAFARDLFSSKLRRYREQFQMRLEDLPALTGIPLDRLMKLESAAADPTGDEVLIFADLYKCDYRFFVSSDRVAPFDETEELFRRHGDVLSQEDRWAIQEFLYLCECETYLLGQLGRSIELGFAYESKDSYYKRAGIAAAGAFRERLGLGPLADITDIFAVLRKVGLRVFRRSLKNSDISGLFVNHPAAGRCILVNYVDDPYRQRFTAAHEAGHAFLDAGEPFVVSFGSGRKWDPKDLVEIRANAFAAHLLLPDDLVSKLPTPAKWNDVGVAELADRLRVNNLTLLYRLQDAGVIDPSEVNRLRDSSGVPRVSKVDPELPASLTTGQRARKQALLERGLSANYVGLCIDALEAGLVSLGRLSEMMMCSDAEVREIAALFGRPLA